MEKGRFVLNMFRRDRRINARSARTSPMIHDMLGNVMEWCSDQYDGAEEFYRKYYGTSGLADPGESYRVVRGGSFVRAPRESRCAYRGPDAPSFRFGVIGFRVVRTVD